MKGIVCVRGGGDLATGVIQKLWHAGFCVYVLEIPDPTTIRRTVALSSALTDGTCTVEDMTAVKVSGLPEIRVAWERGQIPVLDDPAGDTIKLLAPEVLVDAIVAKRNLGTNKDMAPVIVALGPGFRAPEDVDAVIETMRGHDLGRVILNGSAKADTGIPGSVAGYAAERVLHAPSAGTVDVLCDIGTIVGKGQTVCTVGGVPVRAPFAGLVRGMIRPGMTVRAGLKIGDIDPRKDVDWRTISDKARAVGGAALDAVLYIMRKKKL